ncbi:MAG: hypothetical protein K0B85_02560 [Coriobacteriia bacterium]|nr:hypothetical protein [Coriobacteriia bacterium]
MSDDTPIAPPAPPAPPSPEPAAEVDGTTKLLAVLGYPFFIVALIALLIDPYKTQRFSRAHAVQALVLNVVVWVLAWIPVVGWIVGLVAFVFAILAILKALKGEIYEMPLVYDFAKRFIDG